MVIGQRKTTVAYRCPQCGGGVLGVAGDFALSGGRMLKLKCPCGKSELSIAAGNDGKYRLTAPCLLCAGEHHYTVSPTLLYSRELFRLTCPYTNVDVGFAGEESAVSQALDENEKELKKIFADAGIAAMTNRPKDETEDENLLPDAQVYDVVRFLVRELEADGQIECPCRNGAYEIEFVDGGIRVFCQNCGAEHIFPTASVAAAEAFLTLDHLTLTDPRD